MDSEIKKLLSGNLLNTPSRNFTDQTMQKICETSKERPVKKNINRWFILPPLVATAAVVFFLAVYSRIQIWIDSNDAIPLYYEYGFDDYHRAHTDFDFSDIWRDTPLEENLIDLAVPEDWDIDGARVESVGYADTGLGPGITLQIELAGREPLDVTGDVVGVVRVDQTTFSNSDIIYKMRLTIDLEQGTARYLHDYEDANPNEPLIVHFNGQVIVKGNFPPLNPTHLQFDLSLLDLSLSELKNRYFTSTELSGNQSDTRKLEVRLASNEKVDSWERVLSSEGTEALWVSPESVMTNDDVLLAEVSMMEEEYFVSILFTADGASKFAHMTEDHIGEKVAIMVDGQVISAPVIRNRITGGRATLSGDFTYEKAREIAQGITVLKKSE